MRGVRGDVSVKRGGVRRRDVVREVGLGIGARAGGGVKWR